MTQNTVKPDSADWFYNRGNWLIEQGETELAVIHYRRAAQLSPVAADVWNNLGNALLELEDFAEAARCFQRVLRLEPDSADAWFNMGNVALAGSEFWNAEVCYRRSLALLPDFAPACTNLGVSLMEQGRSREALAFYDRSLSLRHDPAVAGNRAKALLAMGNLADGFREYEWRIRDGRQTGFYQRFSCWSRWDGSIFSGKRLLVYDEQGFGDSLQFIRFLPLVKKRGGILVLAVKKPLLRLLARCPGADRIIDQEKAMQEQEFDFAVPLVSLAYVLGTTLKQLPVAVPYVKADADMVLVWRQRIHQNAGDACKVGLVWAGNPENIAGRKRTCGLPALAPLGKLPGVVFYSLQKGAAAADAQRPPLGLTVVDLSPDIEDFADTAAVLENLDLVITVDTAVAHLAGAMAKPVWLLLPHGAEWRWLSDRNDSPWYPGMRLFRQRSPADWRVPVGEAAVALTTWMETERDSHAERH